MGGKSRKSGHISLKLIKKLKSLKEKEDKCNKKIPKFVRGFFEDIKIKGENNEENKKGEENETN